VVRVLHISGYGLRLGARGGALYVRGAGGERLVPLSEVDVVVVATSGVTVTSRAVRLMAKAGVELVFLDHRGEPAAILYPPAPTRTVETRRAQYAAYREPTAALIAGEIVAAKLSNQAAHLRRLNRRRPSGLLREAAAELEGLSKAALEVAAAAGGLEEARGRLLQLEAAGAREYWGALARLLPGELGFRGRSRDAGDPVNAALNYGYGILYSLAWRALVLAGLDPYAGFLHVDRSGKPVLAFDYVEMWRPALVDEPLVAALLSGWRPRLDGPGRLEYGERSRVAGLVKGRLDGRCRGEPRLTCAGAIQSYALRLASSLRSRSPYRAYRCEGGGAWPGSSSYTTLATTGPG